jgi:hypothetical protein
MSSVLRFTSQPKTRKFVNTQNVLQGENGPRVFSQANIDDWLAANGAKIVNYGDLLIIPGTASGSTFLDVLRGDNGATQLNYTSEYDSRKTLTDMGKQLTIGDATESELLVLRLVKTPSDSQTGADFSIGYVVVENNAQDLDTNGGRFMVRVARV